MGGFPFRYPGPTPTWPCTTQSLLLRPHQINAAIKWDALEKPSVQAEQTKVNKSDSLGHLSGTESVYRSPGDSNAKPGLTIKL